MKTLKELAAAMGQNVELYRDAAGQLFGRTTGYFTPSEAVEIRTLIRQWEYVRSGKYLMPHLRPAK